MSHIAAGRCVRSDLAGDRRSAAEVDVHFVRLGRGIGAGTVGTGQGTGQ